MQPKHDPLKSLNEKLKQQNNYGLLHPEVIGRPAANPQVGFNDEFNVIQYQKRNLNNCMPGSSPAIRDGPEIQYRHN